MASDIIGGIGGSIGSLFGSDAAPKAVLNRFAAPTVKASTALGTGLLSDVGGLSKNALDTYLGYQPQMAKLAGQQEGTLNTLLGRQLNYDPNQMLQQVGNTAYGFINPSVVNPLSQFDVNQASITARARGLNPAAVDSTANRLRNARVASQRYYDVARDVTQQLPTLYGQAFNQQQQAAQNAAGYTPQIASAYEGVAQRPTQGIMNRINTVGATQNVAGQTIGNVTAGTQGYKQPRNFADRLGAASADIGSGLSGTLGQLGAVAGAGGGGSL